MNRQRRLVLTICAAACLLTLIAVTSAPVLASQVRPINLEEMTERASTIFSGRCVAAEVQFDADIGRTVQVASFEVFRSVKGSPGSIVTIRTLLGAGTDGSGISGLPRYEVGQEVVLFLYGESKYGLTSPVGFGAGRFHIVMDKHGQPHALNDFGNGRLLDNLSPVARERVPREISTWHGQPLLAPEALLDLAAGLQVAP